MTLECEYKRVRLNENEEITDMTFHTKAVKMYSCNIIENVVNTHFEELKNKESHHQPLRWSGWILYKCKRLIVSLKMNSPLSGSFYVELPKII